MDRDRAHFDILCKHANMLAHTKMILNEVSYFDDNLRLFLVGHASSKSLEKRAMGIQVLIEELQSLQKKVVKECKMARRRTHNGCV